MNLLVFQMRTMSDDTEPRMCDEDLESDVEDYLEEEENSGELMDRLRELEVSQPQSFFFF